MKRTGDKYEMVLILHQQEVGMAADTTGIAHFGNITALNIFYLEEVHLQLCAPLNEGIIIEIWTDQAEEITSFLGPLPAGIQVGSCVPLFRFLRSLCFAVKSPNAWGNSMAETLSKLFLGEIEIRVEERYLSFLLKGLPSDHPEYSLRFYIIDLWDELFPEV